MCVCGFFLFFFVVVLLGFFFFGGGGEGGRLRRSLVARLSIGFVSGLFIADLILFICLIG